MPDCCSEQSLGADLTYEHQGDYVEVFGECLNCGATVKDVFTYARNEIVETGDGEEQPA